MLMAVVMSSLVAVLLEHRRPCNGDEIPACTNSLLNKIARQDVLYDDDDQKWCVMYNSKSPCNPNLSFMAAHSII